MQLNCCYVFLLENLFCNILREAKEALENWENNIENEALSFRVLLEVIYNHCLTIAVAVPGQTNVKLNFSDDS